MIADSSQADNSKAFLKEMESTIGFQVRKKGSVLVLLILFLRNI